MSDPFQNLLPEIQIPLCSIHNLPGVIVNPDVNDTQRPVLCIECLIKHKKVEDQIKENQQIFQDIQNENKSKIDQLNQFLQLINEFLHKVTQRIHKLITLINDEIDLIKLNQTQQNELFVQLKFIEIDKIQQTNEAQNQQFQEFNQLITQQLKIIKQNFNFDNLIQGWQQNQYIQNIEQYSEYFQYSQVIKSIQQKEDCYAIAINSNNSIVAAADNNKIRIFEFQNENLKEIQQLDDHINTIQCLNFMKKSQLLVSACYGGQIRIWELNNNKQSYYIQVLNEHKDSINCLQFNQNEDLIISGSSDKTIKFWKLDQTQWKCNQTLQIQNKVYSLSLNESNSKLIAIICNQMQINVFHKNGNEWHLTQAIRLFKYTNRICFINNNQFAVQLIQSDLLQIFNFNKIDNQFQLGLEIKVKYGESDYHLFPMQFIKSKDMLIDKNCQYINILKIEQNGEFTLIQTIDFGLSSLYGCVSDNGSYLFTWDLKSKQIQVRKLEMI